MPAVLLAACDRFDPLPRVADPCAVWEAPGLYSFELEAGGRNRDAYVFVPGSEGPRDLVVALHGGGMSAESFSENTDYLALARQEGFVAVFPKGKKMGFLPGWNSGSCCGSLDDDHRAIEDVAFLDRLVVELSDRVCGDRVLATGFSQGGMMTHRWACEGEHVDAAVASSGPLMTDRCSGPPVPIRHYHGVDDPVVPPDGGGEYTSVDETMATWRARNRCDDDAVETVTGRMTCTSWSCEVPTELCLLESWTHRWPGGRNAKDAGDGIDATEDAWTFLLGAVPVP